MAKKKYTPKDKAPKNEPLIVPATPEDVGALIEPHNPADRPKPQTDEHSFEVRGPAKETTPFEFPLPPMPKNPSIGKEDRLIRHNKNLTGRITIALPDEYDSNTGAQLLYVMNFVDGACKVPQKIVDIIRKEGLETLFYII